jgi:hypothetical protein
MSSFVDQIFGKKPNVPAWNDVSLTDSQTKAVSANQAALPDIEKLAAGVNTFNQDQVTKLLNSAIPGWSSMTEQAGRNVASELRGEIPADVSWAIQSSDAARALTGGFGGSGLAGNMFARDLGLTSLDLMQRGESSLESWGKMVESVYGPGQFNVSSMFITPQDQFQATFENQQMQWGQQWLQSQVDAMPDPLLHAVDSTLKSFMQSYLGSLGGGKMGGGASAGGSGASA